MKRFLLTLASLLVVGFGIFTTSPAAAYSVPYTIGQVEDLLNDSTYFNGWEHLETADFSGTWQYTVIGFESNNANWVHEGDHSETFASYYPGQLGTFNSVNFDTHNLYFQDFGGPYDIALDVNLNNNFFELFRLTSASDTLSYLSTPITLGEGTIIVGFNDNGYGPRVGDADFDDFIVALVPGSDGTISAVPEPGTMLLLGCGLMGLAGMGRRRFQE
ncbi:MAG: PEP-CTERM sorting domain-containing protein [Desulfobacterales bacterium]|nr:PEP-CTERM sorting domain-containing protein [Desulfobacterales bacterium]